MKKSLFIYSLILFSTLGWSQISTMSSPLKGTTTQAAKIVDPPPPAPNIVAFDYDVAGNQIKRNFIYVASGIYRQTNQPIEQNNSKEELIESDIFSDILYYPNPVQSELFLKWKNTDVNFVDRIELYSLSGQLIKNISSIKGVEETTVDFQSLPSGYYNLLLVYSSGEAKDLKIIKK